MSEEELDYSKLKVAELKAELKKRGLSIEGKKTELLERLQTCIGDSALLDDTHDDLLDDEVLSEDDVLNDTPIDTPTEPPLTNKRPSDSTDDDSKRHPKKIILNRKIVAEPPPVEEDKSQEDPKPEPVEEKPSSESSGSKVIKLSALSEKERLERRAARFGQTTPAAVPAQGTKNGQFNSLPKTTSKIAAAPSTDLSVLKKRAERFGAVAPILEKVELDERKKKRLERFSGGDKSAPLEPTAKIVTAPSNGGSVDKKAQRAERFKAAS